jgi:hypothetical protein
LQAQDDQPELIDLGTRRGKLRVIVGQLRGKLSHQSDAVHRHRHAAR